MTTIGTAVLQIIPSLQGVSESVEQQLGGKFSSFGAKAGKDFGSGLAGGIEANEARVKASLDKYNTLYNRHADALGKVRVEQAKLEAEKAKGQQNDVKILAQTERLEAARRKETQTLKLATDQQKLYDEAQKRTAETAAKASASGGGFSGLSGTAEKLFGSLKQATGALGPLGGALEGAAGSATGMGSSMLSAASGAGVMGAAVGVGALALTGIVAVGAEVTGKLYEIGAAFNEMANSVSFSTGLTGDDLNKLTGSVENVAKSTPGTIEQIGGVAAGVSRSLHTTGSDLEEVTKSITNLDVKTGEATNIRELGKAFRGFGVDAASQNDALNQLYTASTKTGQSVNDLIHNVTIGGAPLRELGLDFGHSAALLSSFENAGLDGTKMVTGLRKAVGEFAKEHKDIPKALAESVTQLEAFRKSGDEASGVDLANKLFGPKTGIQFWDAVKSGAIDLETLSGSLDGTTLSINDMADKTETAGEKWQKLKNNIEAAVQPLATKLFDGVQSGLTGLGEWVSSHQSEIIGFFTKFGDIVLAVAQDATVSLGQLIVAVGQAGHAIGDTISGILRAGAAAQDLFGQHDTADEWRKQADQFGNWGVSIENAGNKMISFGGNIETFRDHLRNAGVDAETAAKFTDALGKATVSLPDGKTIELKDNSPEVTEKLKALGIQVTTLPDGKVTVIPQTEQAKAIIDAFIAQERHLSITADVKTADGTPIPGSALALNAANAPGHAAGGAITGAGGPTSDIIPIWASNGEYIVNAAATRKNMPLLEIINSGKIQGYAAGGLVAGISEAQAIGHGTPYQYGGVGPLFDCSGAQSDVFAAFTGKPTGVRYFTTESNFESLGFMKGSQPGAYNIGVHRAGGGQLSHMAGTLPNGVNFESGGAHNSTLYGGAAAGASSPQFELHYYLPVGGGDNPKAPTASGAAPVGTTGGKSGGSGGGGGGGSSSGSGGGGGGVSLASSFSGLAATGLSGLDVKTKVNENSPERTFKYGDALAAGVSGQVTSALGVLGITDSPPILQAASKLLEGISVGGKGGAGDAGPIAGSPLAAPGAAETLHGAANSAGPGPGNSNGPVYNIQTATIPDAFLAAQQKEREAAAARIQRF